MLSINCLKWQHSVDGKVWVLAIITKYWNIFFFYGTWETIQQDKNERFLSIKIMALKLTHLKFVFVLGSSFCKYCTLNCSSQITEIFQLFYWFILTVSNHFAFKFWFFLFLLYSQQNVPVKLPQYSWTIEGETYFVNRTISNWYVKES